MFRLYNWYASWSTALNSDAHAHGDRDTEADGHAQADEDSKADRHAQADEDSQALAGVRSQEPAGVPPPAMPRPS
ncbi:MAG: hypothetical protein ACRDGI_02190 [Candidatus Limnocylindrales bacterium]